MLCPATRAVRYVVNVMASNYRMQEPRDMLRENEGMMPRIIKTGVKEV